MPLRCRRAPCSRRSPSENPVPVPTSFFRSETAEMIREEGLQRGLARAEVRGWAECVLRVLVFRRFEVGDAVRERVVTCRDLDTLDRWFDRAYAPEVTRAEDIFAGTPVAPSVSVEARAFRLAEGQARGVIALLDSRGVEIGDLARERITACTDPATLDRWFNRAHTVPRAEDLFSG